MNSSHEDQWRDYLGAQEPLWNSWLQKLKGAVWTMGIQT